MEVRKQVQQRIEDSGLTRSHRTGGHHEPPPADYPLHQRHQGVAVRVRQVEELGVGRQREWFPLQIKEVQVHVRTRFLMDSAEIFCATILPKLALVELTISR